MIGGRLEHEDSVYFCRMNPAHSSVARVARRRLQKTPKDPKRPLNCLLKQSQSDTLFVARNPQKEKHLYDSSPSRKSAKTVVQLGQTVFGVGPRFRLGNRRVDDLYMYEKWLPLFNFRSSLCAQIMVC